MLDIARIEAGRVELSLEPVRVSEALSETLDLIRPLAAERGVTLARRSATTIRCTTGTSWPTASGFKQVLLNLFSNAVKYNRQGGSVHLTFEPAAEGRGCA